MVGLKEFYFLQTGGLVNQARDSFNDFIGSARIEFETYPGMMNKLQRQDYNSSKVRSGAF